MNYDVKLVNNSDELNWCASHMIGCSWYLSTIDTRACFYDGFMYVVMAEGFNTLHVGSTRHQICMTDNKFTDDADKSFFLVFNRNDLPDGKVSVISRRGNIFCCDIDTIEHETGINRSQFKPLTEKQLEERGVLTISNARRRISEGESLYGVFSGVVPQSNGLSVVWYDFNGIKKYNIVRKTDDGEYEFISDSWMSNFNRMTDDFFIYVCRSRFYIFYNGESQVNDMCFDHVVPYLSDSVVYVKRDNLANCVLMDGTLLSDIWFTGSYGRWFGLFVVSIDGRYNAMDKNGRFISKVWFDAIKQPHYFSPYGYFLVQLNGKWNVLDIKSGRLISNIWFDDVHDSSDSCFNIMLRRGVEETWLVLNLDGTMTDMRDNEFKPLTRFDIRMEAAKKQRISYMKNKLDEIRREQHI